MEKTGPLEVTIRLGKPDVLLHELMAASPGTVVSAASLTKEGKDYGTPKGDLNCTGPFALEKWAQGDNITLRANPEYWDKKLAPRSRSVKFTFVEDPAARSNAFLSGTADGGYMVPSTALAHLRTAGKGSVLFGPNTAAANLAVLDFHGPLGDRKVREALSMALDRKNIIKAAAGGVGLPAKAPPRAAPGRSSRRRPRPSTTRSPSPCTTSRAPRSSSGRPVRAAARSPS